MYSTVCEEVMHGAEFKSAHFETENRIEAPKKKEGYVKTNENLSANAAFKNSIKWLRKVSVSMFE